MAGRRENSSTRPRVKSLPAVIRASVQSFSAGSFTPDRGKTSMKGEKRTRAGPSPGPDPFNFAPPFIPLAPGIMISYRTLAILLAAIFMLWPRPGEPVAVPVGQLPTVAVSVTDEPYVAGFRLDVTDVVVEAP